VSSVGVPFSEARVIPPTLLTSLAVNKVVHSHSIPLVLLTPSPTNLHRCHQIRAVDVRQVGRILRARIWPFERPSPPSNVREKPGRLLSPTSTNVGYTERLRVWLCEHGSDRHRCHPHFWAACVRISVAQSRRLTTHRLCHICGWAGTCGMRRTLGVV
jgi:hypothetical protein